MVSKTRPIITVQKVADPLRDNDGWRSFQREYIAYCRKVKYLDAIHPDDRPGPHRIERVRYDIQDFLIKPIDREIQLRKDGSPAAMAMRIDFFQIRFGAAKENMRRAMRNHLREERQNGYWFPKRRRFQDDAAARMFIAERVDDQILAACDLNIHKSRAGALTWYNRLKKYMEDDYLPLVDMREYEETMAILSTISETDTPRETQKKLREWRSGMDNAKQAGVVYAMTPLLWMDHVYKYFCKEWLFLVETVEEIEYVNITSELFTFEEFVAHILYNRPGAFVGDYDVYEDDVLEIDDEYEYFG